MNTETETIEIEKDEAPALSTITRFTRSHRVISSVIAIAVASGIALTSCYAVKSHQSESIPKSKEPLVYDIAKKREWLPSKTATVKHSASGTGITSADTRNFQLTFDDGPNPQYTPLILDWLKANHLHATFFVVGENANRYPALVKRIMEEGHQIGNHSWSHPKLTAMSDSAVRSQLQRTHEAIVKACGVAPKAFRPPYGAISPRQREWIEKEFAYKTVLWDIDTEDWKARSTGAIAATIEHGIRGKGPHVILAHDIHPRILPALESLLPKLQARGIVPKDQTTFAGLIAKAP
jgi:peptidoglycan/xylan/chitin deacetylase (PgdA/CDA1 family)